MKFDPFAIAPAPHAAHLPHVVIVGGGASGVLLAAHLLRDPGAPLRVTVIEGRHMLGCGVAYSTADPGHLLNTRVANMSAFPDDPTISAAGWPTGGMRRQAPASSAARPMAAT